MKKTKFLHAVFFIICLASCTEKHQLSLKGRNCCWLNASILTGKENDIEFSDSLILFEGNQLPSTKAEISNQIVFPANGKPVTTHNKLIKVKNPTVIEVNIYFDENLFRNGIFEQVQKDFYQANLLLKGFQNGYAFKINKFTIVEGYTLRFANSDQIFRTLKQEKVIDESRKWHLFYLNFDHLALGSSAFHMVSNNHHMIFNDQFLLSNPISLLHELLHGFPGHVDLEIDDSIIKDSSMAVQNIMYNYDIPKIPKYSFYQNMFANEITGSNYLGINGFPLRQVDKDFGLKNLNTKPFYYVELMNEKSESVQEKYFSNLLSSPFEKYILNFESSIKNHPEIINCKEELEYYLKNPIDKKHLRVFKIALEKEAKYLSMHGLKDRAKYIRHRIIKHEELRLQKILSWYLEFEISSSQHYIDVESLIPEEYMLKYKEFIKKNRRSFDYIG